MSIVEHSKCKNCSKVRHLSELKENPSGIGMVCLDDETCKKEQSKTKAKKGVLVMSNKGKSNE